MAFGSNLNDPKAMVRALDDGLHIIEREDPHAAGPRGRAITGG